MNSWVAALLVCMGGIQLYNAALFTTVHLRNPVEAEYRSFAYVALGFAIFLFGALQSHLGIDRAAATPGFDIEVIGGSVAATAYTAFTFQLLGDRHSELPKITQIGALLTVAVALMGLTSDPGQGPSWLSRGTATLQPTVLGIVWIAAVVVLLLYLSYQSVHRATSDVDLRPVAAGILLLVAAALHDATKLVVGLSTPFLAEKVTVVPIFLAGLVLARRVLRAGDRLSERSQELRSNLGRLETIRGDLIATQQSAAVGGLAAALAHEIRNPLAVMRNSVSGLRRGVGSDDEGVLLDILDEEAERLDRLVLDLRSYASTSLPADEPVILRDLVEQALAEAQLKAEAIDDIDIRVSIDSAPISIWGDSDSLKRALVNVIANGLQAMPRGGELTISASEALFQERPGVQLKIWDTGEGMDTLVRTKALDPFFTTRPSGTGLGLAITERVVREHGGEINVSSRYGLGTTVTILLSCEPQTDAPE